MEPAMELTKLDGNLAGAKKKKKKKAHFTPAESTSWPLWDASHRAFSLTLSRPEKIEENKLRATEGLQFTIDLWDTIPPALWSCTLASPTLSKKMADALIKIYLFCNKTLPDPVKNILAPAIDIFASIGKANKLAATVTDPSTFRTALAVQAACRFLDPAILKLYSEGFDPSCMWGIVSKGN
jgi:hypothetical protein